MIILQHPRGYMCQHDGPELGMGFLSRLLPTSAHPCEAALNLYGPYHPHGYTVYQFLLDHIVYRLAVVTVSLRETRHSGILALK